MTAREFAVLVGAKEVKRGKLWKARCPAHRGKDRNLDISDGKKGVVLTCWSHHCTEKEICKAVGIRVPDLFFDSKTTKEIRQRVSLRDRKENLERRWILCEMLAILEPKSRRYWLTRARRNWWELFWVRWELEPEKVELEALRCVRAPSKSLHPNSEPSSFCLTLKPPSPSIKG